MTHWVIREYQGQIFAGADELTSGPDLPSEISGTGAHPDEIGTMPDVHSEDLTKKIAIPVANEDANYANVSR